MTKTTDYAIEARRVGTDGSLPGSIVTLHSGTNTIAVFPDLAVSSGDWLVIWQQNASGRDLYGRWVQSNGTLGDETLALITAASNQAHPALAEGSDAGGMLLVWEDDRDSEDAIYHGIILPIHLETTVIDYTYDPLYRLVEAGYSGNLTANYQYVYDSMGNRTMFTRTITSTLVTTYTYNTANQLVTAKLNTSATTWYYEFDARGNQIRQVPNSLTPANGEIRYTFNQANQLVRIEKHNGTSYQTQATALYDGDGYRRQTEAYLVGIPFTNTYAVDVLQDGVPLTVQNSLLTTQILYGLYGIGEYQDDDWLYYQGDASLSVRQMADGDGQIVLAQTYAPYGSLLQLAGDGEAIFGFAGSQAGGLNLLYGSKRYFDPETGRYLTPDYSDFDPKHPSRGLNPYTSVLILAPLFIAIGLRKRKGGKIQWYTWLLLGTSIIFTLTACERPVTPTPTPPDPDGTGTPDASEIDTPTSEPTTPSQASTGTPTPPPTPSGTPTPQPTVEIIVCPTPTTATPTSTSTPTPSPFELLPSSTEGLDLRNGPSSNPGGLQAYNAFVKLQEEVGAWWGNEIDALEAMVMILNHEFGNLRNVGGPNRLPPQALETITRKYNNYCLSGPWSDACLNGFWAYSQAITEAEFSQAQRNNIRNNPRYSYEGFPNELRQMALEVMYSPGVGVEEPNKPSHWFTLNNLTPVSRQRYWDSIKTYGLGAEPPKEVYWCWPLPNRDVPDEPTPLEIFVIFTGTQYPGTIRD